MLMPLSAPSLGGSQNGNTSEKMKSSSTSKLLSSHECTAITAFGTDHENDVACLAEIHSKKLNHDIANITVQKAKLDLLVQCEAGLHETKHEENCICLLKLQLHLSQGHRNGTSGLHLPSPASGHPSHGDPFISAYSVNHSFNSSFGNSGYVSGKDSFQFDFMSSS